MHVLLDEQLPRHLARELTEHQVRTVQEQGWAGLKNGELLQRAADAGFEIFVTADQNRVSTEPGSVSARFLLQESTRHVCLART